jgi:sortase A
MGISSPLGLDDNDTRLTGQGVRRRAAPRADTALRLLQWLLLIIGSVLLVVYAAAQVDGARGREQALEAFAQARSEHKAAAPQAKSSAPAKASAPSPATLEYSSEPDQTLWGKSRIAAYSDALRVHGDIPLGVLTISSIELEAPIFDGTSELTLNRGIGRIEGTADVGAAGNLGLAGHRDGFFRGLKDVEVGDTINVESLDGTTRYRITELSIVEPSDVHVLAPTDTATLTLVTCYPFYFIGEAPQRYIVKGVAATASDAR